MRPERDYGCGPGGSRSDFQFWPGDRHMTIDVEWPKLKPRSRSSGILAKQETQAELPPGANDYEMTALSTRPYVRQFLKKLLTCRPTDRSHYNLKFVGRELSLINRYSLLVGILISNLTSENTDRCVPALIRLNQSIFFKFNYLYNQTVQII